MGENGFCMSHGFVKLLSHLQISNFILLACSYFKCVGVKRKLCRLFFQQTLSVLVAFVVVVLGFGCLCRNKSFESFAECPPTNLVFARVSLARRDDCNLWSGAVSSFEK